MFAIVGLSLAMWTVLRPVSGASHIPTSVPEPVAAARPEAPAQMPPTYTLNYTQLNTKTDVDNAMNDFQMKVHSLAREDEGLKSMGEEAIQSFANAASLAIKPFLLGSFEDYQSSVKALGGESVDKEYYTSQEGYHRQFAMRPVSTDEGVRVVPFARHGVDRSFEEWHMSLGDPLVTGKLGISTTANIKRYPAVTSYRTRKLDVYEVRIPILALAYDDPMREISAQLGVALAWDSAANRWQPVQYLVYKPAIHSVDDPTVRGVRY